MKAINTSRIVKIAYPRETPRISRKRVWMDRSEWRKDPSGTTYPTGTDMIDKQMEVSRTQPTLADTPSNNFPDLMDRAGRVGLRRT